MGKDIKCFEKRVKKYTEDLMNLLDKWEKEEGPASEMMLAGVVLFIEYAMQDSRDKYELAKKINIIRRFTLVIGLFCLFLLIVIFNHLGII